MKSLVGTFSAIANQDTNCFVPIVALSDKTELENNLLKVPNTCSPTTPLAGYPVPKSCRKLSIVRTIAFPCWALMSLRRGWLSNTDFMNNTLSVVLVNHAISCKYLCMAPTSLRRNNGTRLSLRVFMLLGNCLRNSISSVRIRSAPKLSALPSVGVSPLSRWMGL